jgi:2-phospho-L-lactate guanylyltransferase
MPEFEVLVPVKRLASAKRRLGAVMTAPARADLVGEMSARVLRAVTAAAGVGRVFVVTPDPKVAELAARHGAAVLPDPGGGLNAALQAAVQNRLAAGATSLAIFQGDLPWLTTEAVEDFLRHAQRPGEAALVPDQHGRGTSALAWRGPPALTRFAFGQDSFARHARLARDAGLALSVIEPNRPFHDLDDAADLAELGGYVVAEATFSPTT